MNWTSPGGFPGGASGKEHPCQCRRSKRCRFYPWVGKIPWRRAWQPVFSHILAWRIPWTEELGSPWGHKESDRTETTAHTHGDSVVKIFPANARDVGSVPGSGRFPAEGNDNLLQYSCLENLLDRGAWGVMVHGVTKVLYMT